ncbi:hypothetical protein BGC31_01680 [Komagataeibacter xylinus]|nr:hypothetical protein BGC31_01680 [Komagataeibacter xylinus]RFP05017.1 hypothetical protein BFX83_00500 [Komagataeibacter xylinus]
MTTINEINDIFIAEQSMYGTLILQSKGKPRRCSIMPPYDDTPAFFTQKFIKRSTTIAIMKKNSNIWVLFQQLMKGRCTFYRNVRKCARIIII